MMLLLYISMATAAIFEGSERYRADVLASDLKRPWAVAVGPDKRFYITEKSGGIVVFENGSQVGRVTGIPKELTVVGQGGLMDMVFHPKFESNQYVYLSYSTKANARPTNGINTRVSRFRLVGNKLTEEKVLVQGAYGTDGAHFGCRLAFDRSGKLFATFGERHEKELAQDLKFLNGKVIRINDDGSVPPDNPYFNVPGARKEIFTLGHRNPQGIDVHPELDTPVISEHGPSGYDAELPGRGGIGNADEVNWLIKGRNYGWPVVFGDPSILPWTEGMHQFVRENNVVMPVKEFTVPDGIAPAGSSFYTGGAFPLWKNDFFVAALRGYLVRLKISKSGKLIEQEKIIPRGFSRLRDVVTGPDGYIYAIGADKLIRIMPVKTGTDSGLEDSDREATLEKGVAKIFTEKGCVGCHAELDDLGTLPPWLLGETAETSRFYLAIEQDRMPIGRPPLSLQEKQIVLEWLRKNFFN